uniref:Fibronectin type-III domain-containing protein n=1 Tax=Wuchereria bancrofti TaxID=6293 RepID=A0A1I8EMK1_WUCBA
MQQMSRAQTNSNANLYVIQWRWSLHKDGTSISDWQTIVTRNKMYAILKHLLAPGRYYTFRVAAVNTYGSLGFSKSSQPFKLSKEPRAPGQPLDLTLGKSEIDEQNFWKQRIKWNPPLSELPIKNYIIYAIVDSSDGELHGEKAIIYVRTGAMNVNKDGYDSNNATITTTIQSQEMKLESENRLQDLSDIRTDMKVEMLDVRAPYFDDNNLKTVISWFRNGLCNGTRVKYRVRWRLLMCQTKDDSKHITYYDLDSSGEDWAQMEVQECVAVLEDLDFGCSYDVELISTSTKKIIAKAHFETQSCEKTPSTITLTCNDQSISQSLVCMTNWRNNSVQCSWKNNNNNNGTGKNVGYRIVLSKSDEVNNQIIIIPPQTTTIQFDKVEPDRDYFVHVQMITSNGLGNTLTTSFRINRNKTSEKHSTIFSSDYGRNNTLSHFNNIIMDHTSNNQISQNIDLQSVMEEDNEFLYNNERFPGATILELPLESVASDVIRFTAFYFICINILLRYLLIADNTL